MFTSSWIVFMTSKTLRTLKELNTILAKKKCQYSYQLVFLKLKAISSSHAFFHMFLYLKNEKCLFQTEFINDMYGIYRIASVILKLKFLYISEQSSFYNLRFLQQYAQEFHSAVFFLSQMSFHARYHRHFHTWIS